MRVSFLIDLALFGGGGFLFLALFFSGLRAYPAQWIQPILCPLGTIEFVNGSLYSAVRAYFRGGLSRIYGHHAIATAPFVLDILV